MLANLGKLGVNVVGARRGRRSSERREWLKKEHKLGTNSASWIAERVDGKGTEEDSPEAYLKTAAEWVEAQYAGPRAALRPLYEQLLTLGFSLGKDVKASPCKTMVPFYRNHVWLLKNSLFVPNSQNQGNRKCLGDPRKSIVGLPDAILFLRISWKRVFQQPHVFAQIKPSTNTRIDLGFALGNMRTPKRLIDTGGFEKKDRITRRIEVRSKADIDDELKRWLKKAYELDE